MGPRTRRSRALQWWEYEDAAGALEFGTWSLELLFGASKLRNASMNDGWMIQVENLTKRYAGHTAVSNISFNVARGEVVGLLGPNGAGKSTTMRILSCFLPATSGTVRISGLDVFRHSDEVRRRIGYMPENNPLHFDMRVREYLRFRARLKGLSFKRARQRVDAV